MAQQLPRLPDLRQARGRWSQIDLSAQFIELMEKLGIAYDVVRVGRRSVRVKP